jgi:hypothetical protein
MQEAGLIKNGFTQKKTFQGARQKAKNSLEIRESQAGSLPTMQAVKAISSGMRFLWILPG